MQRTKYISYVILAILITFSISLIPADANLYTSEKKAEKKKFNKNDVYWMAMNIYHEARNQPKIGQIAVAMVTLNRLEDSRYPKNIKDVVTEDCQFSWWCFTKNHTPKDKETWDKIYNLAYSILKAYENDDIIDVVEGATHYHATYVDPPWSKKAKKTVQINDHIFYTWKNI